LKCLFTTDCVLGLPPSTEDSACQTINPTTTTEPTPTLPPNTTSTEPIQPPPPPPPPSTTQSEPTQPLSPTTTQTSPINAQTQGQKRPHPGGNESEDIGNSHGQNNGIGSTTDGKVKKRKTAAGKTKRGSSKLARGRGSKNGGIGGHKVGEEEAK
jgi:hypothetical protein